MQLRVAVQARRFVFAITIATLGCARGAPVASGVVATAAHVDLVRTDIWYQVSPLAHIGLEYPAWSTVCGWYLLAGCAGFVASALATPKTGQKISKQGL